MPNLFTLISEMGNFRDKKFGRRDSGRSSYGGSRVFDRDSDRPRRSFGKSSFEKEMFNAVCDKCGERCEVPFKPTGEKPVYCSNCFRKSDRFESRGTSPANNDFAIINEKLDRILDALSRR